MYLPFLSLLLITYTIYKLFPSKNNTNKALQPYPIVGHLPQFLRNRRRLLDWLSDDVLAKLPANTFTFRRIGVRGVDTANRANVEHVLKTHFDRYPKGEYFRTVLRDFLGNGIFNADGEEWRFQRKMSSFEFNTKSIRSFVVRCVEEEIVSRLMPLFCRACDDGGVVDVQDVLERFAFDNVCKVVFNFDPCCLVGNEELRCEKDFVDFMVAFRDAAELSSGRFRYALPLLWKIKRLLGIGSERRLREAIDVVNRFAFDIIRSRRNGNENADDLLSRFIDNDEYSEELLRDIIISFILAGRETTSSGLSWVFWLISSRPDVEAKILDEIALIRARRPVTDSGFMFSFDELREMHYLHAAITESIRLYPPVPLDSVTCAFDDVLPDGTEVKKGWFITYSAYAMGRMEANWGEDCREYRPERWLDHEGKFRPESPFKFTAFHAGPRMCLGKEMAYIQMKSIAACVIENFVFEVIDKGIEPVKTISLTLRMNGGLPVYVKKRSMVCM